MRITSFVHGAVLCGSLLMSACSHPLPKLAYPDGSHRVPINPSKPGTVAPGQAPAEAPASRS